MEYIISGAVILGVLILMAALRIFLESRVQKGFRLIRSGHPAEAVQYFRKLKISQKKDYIVHWGLAKAYYDMDDPDSSIDELKKISPLEADSYRAFTARAYHTLMAENLESAGRYDQAVRELIDIKNRISDTWEIDLRIAQCFFQLEDKAKTLHFLDLVLKRNPKSYEALMLTGRILFEKGSLTESRTYLEKAVRINRRDKQARAYLGLIHFKSGKIDLALDFLLRAEPPAPISRQARLTLGLIRFQKKDMEEVWNILQPLIPELEGGSSLLYKETAYHATRAAEIIGKFSEAHILWNRLYALEPEFRDVSVRWNALAQYKDNDRLKKYLFSGSGYMKFMLFDVLKKQGYLPQNFKEISDCIFDLVVLKPEEDGGQASRILIKFIRSLTERVDHVFLKSVYRTVRDLKCQKGIIYTTGPVEDLTDRRDLYLPIDVLPTDDLLKLLS